MQRGVRSGALSVLVREKLCREQVGAQDKRLSIVFAGAVHYLIHQRSFRSWDRCLKPASGRMVFYDYD